MYSKIFVMRNEYNLINDKTDKDLLKNWFRVLGVSLLLNENFSKNVYFFLRFDLR